MMLDELRMVVLPGTGLAARFARVVLLVPAFSREQAELVRQMVQYARDASAAAQPGRTLPRRLAGLLVGPEGDNVPSFCAMGAIGEDVGMMVYGDTEVDATGSVGSVHISGTEAATWVDRIIGGGFAAVSMRASGQDAADETSLFELGLGVIPAAAALLTMTGASALVRPPPVAEPAVAPPLEEPAAVEGPPAVAPEPEPPAPVEAADAQEVYVSLSEPTEAERAISSGPLTDSITFKDTTDAEKREPLPILSPAADGAASSEEAAAVAEPERPAAIVKGVRCKHGHFNHPQALYCAYDGSALVDVTRIEVDGPRPSLGVLVFDDGRAFSLEAGYIVGRRPHDHPALDSGEALPLIVEDAQEQVSRNHLLIELTGWDVSITDLGSRNGTFLLAPGTRQSVRLAANQAQLLQPGARVHLGERSFVYESHHRR